MTALHGSSRLTGIVMAEKKASLPHDATCLGCGCRLVNLPIHTCPECGRWFDPHDSSTFRIGPKSQLSSSDETSDCSWIVESLGSATNVTRQNEAIGNMVRGNEFASLVSLAQALESDTKGIRWAVEAVFDHLERSVGLCASLDAAKTTLDIAAIPRVRSVQVPRDPNARIRRLASFLGFAQPFEVLDEVVRDADIRRHEELMACWMQEHLIRHGSIGEHSQVAAFWSGLAQRQHPLTALPLRLLPSESHLWELLPTYRSTDARSVTSRRSVDESQCEPAVLDKRLTIEGLLTVPDDLTRPFAGWLKESNGRVDAHACAISEGTFDRADFAETLLRLDVSALAGAGSQDIRCHKVPYERALEALFSAGSGGGAYGGSVHAAYARLFAWRSMAAFMRVQFTDLEELDRLARDSMWFLFDSSSDWFYDIAWDIGVVCIPSDGRSMTLLAATDTD